MEVQLPQRKTSRAAAGAALLLALLLAACQTGGGGMGLDFTAGSPGWGQFESSKMFGAPM